MQVSVEATEGLERRMTVQVEESQIADKVEQRLKSLVKTTKLKGFRKGKVPMKVVKQHYGKQVRLEVMSDVMQQSFYAAVTQEKIRPAGMPNFAPDETSLNKEGFTYTATFEVYPEVVLADLSSTEVEKPVVNISAADIDEMIETIRKQHIDWQEADRVAQHGDRLDVDFKGMIDGEVFAGGEAQGQDIEIGAGRLIPGFEDGLIGMAKGASKTLDLSFPKTYHAKEFAGKDVKFDITVNRIDEPVLPEVNAEFAKKMGVEDGAVEKFRDEIKENMELELADKLQMKIKTAVMDALITAHDVQIPQALIDSEAQALLQQMQQNLVSQGMNKDDLKMSPDMFKDQAERRVALGLIMAEVAKQKEIKADDDEVRAKVETIAKPYQQPQEVIDWYYADKSRLSEIESLVYEDKITEWALNSAKVVEKTTAFKEIMSPATNAG